MKKDRKQIDRSDIVIIVVGEDTHNAPGVKKEVMIAKPMFQVRPQHRTAGEVRGGGDVIPWKWKRINAKIAEYLAVSERVLVKEGSCGGNV